MPWSARKLPEFVRRAAVAATLLATCWSSPARALDETESEDPVVKLKSVEFQSRVAPQAPSQAEPRSDKSRRDQPPPAEKPSIRPETPRFNGMAFLHFGDGVGAGADWRLGVFGLRAIAAYNPLRFVVDDDTNDAKFGQFRVAHSAHFGLDMPLLFGASEIGVSLGYRYNTVLGHGGALAFQANFTLWRQQFALWLPLAYFPKGDQRARKELSVPSSYGLNYPLSASIMSGVGVGWLF